MSVPTPSRQRIVSFHSRWTGAAFLVEAMLLLVFAAFSMVVITQMLAASVERSEQSERLAQAVALASNVAERFATTPDEVQDSVVQGNLVAVSDVRSETRPGGVMYDATIKVYTAEDMVADEQGAVRAPAGDLRPRANAKPVYVLSTSVYTSGVQAHG